MSNAKLSDEQWDKVLNFLRQQEGIYIGNERDCRRFVAVLWVLRSGAQGRLLPADQGAVELRLPPLCALGAKPGVGPHAGVFQRGC
ncbi:MAG: transposase [Candidatus Competibacteraceae bacterium]|nr:transposase [Candidatus Competibacteraceae bacterium]